MSLITCKVQAFFHVHTVHLDNYQSFSPTDAQLDSLKTILNLH